MPYREVDLDLKLEILKKYWGKSTKAATLARQHKVSRDFIYSWAREAEQTLIKTQALRTQLQESMFELRLLRWQKDVDQAAVEAKIKEINELRTQLYNERQQARQEMPELTHELQTWHCKRH